LFADLYGNNALKMTLRPIDDDVLIDIYTNKTLAPAMSLNYQCCLLRYGRTFNDVGQHEWQK